MINITVKPSPDITIVVDGMNELYKNFYKLRQQINENSAAFYGTVRSVFSYFKMGNNVIVIWEGRSKKRKEENADYKANRPKMPDNFYEQLADTRKFLAHFVKQYIVTDYEADDMMAKIAVTRSLQNKKTIIVTSDDDLHQVIDENVSVYAASKKIMYTPSNLKYENARKLICLWAIEGDGSDNIIGIKGIRNRKELVEKYFENNNLYINEEQMKIAFDDFIKKIQDAKEKNADVITENYDKILMNMNLLRLRDVPKENYSKIEPGEDPKVYIEKYNCKSFYQYISSNGGLI